MTGGIFAASTDAAAEVGSGAAELVKLTRRDTYAVRALVELVEPEDRPGRCPCAAADVALEMHDRMIGALMNRAEKMRDEGFRKHGKAINEKLGLYARLGKALIEARESGDDPYDVLEEMVGWERFVASVAEAEGLALPANFDYLG